MDHFTCVRQTTLQTTQLPCGGKQQLNKNLEVKLVLIFGYLETKGQILNQDGDRWKYGPERQPDREIIGGSRGHKNGDDRY